MSTEIRLDEQGLVPVIAQDAQTGAVLMVAHMNREALQRTLDTGQAWFYSRSRQELWHKGETSGNYLNVVEMRPDCDGDVILLRVNAEGPACHTGNDTCFYQEMDTSNWTMMPADQPAFSGALQSLSNTIAQRKRDRPEGSYTAELFERGTERIAQKVIEEAGETALAAMARAPERVKEEAADLLYHLLILLEDSGVTPSDVAQVLIARRS